MKSSAFRAPKARVGLGVFSTEKAAEALQRNDASFLARFTPHEKSYSLGKKRAAESMAGRMAAKLAFWDAVGVRSPERRFRPPEWQGAAVERHSAGPPRLCLDEGLLRKFGIGPESHILLSITHEKSFAAAVVVIESA